MTDPSIELARQSYEAFARRDRAAMEALLAEDFHFTSPYDNRIDRKTYFERCWPGGENSAGFSFVHLVRDGERVFVTYEARWKNGRAGRNTEIVTLRDGKLVEVEVYFGWSLPHDAKSGGFVEPKRGT